MVLQHFLTLIIIHIVIERNSNEYKVLFFTVLIASLFPIDSSFFLRNELNNKMNTLKFTGKQADINENISNPKLHDIFGISI